MKHLLVAVLAWVCACGGSKPSPTPGPGSSASAQVSAEHQDMISKMDTFLLDPSAGDPQQIMSWVSQSPAVTVVFDQRLLPLEEGLPEGANALLLTGFAAGSARSQLAAGVDRDDPVAGVRGALAVYGFLKSKNPAVSSPHLDELAARDAAGTLEAAVTERLAAPQPR
jgi:hypothetical protein